MGGGGTARIWVKDAYLIPFSKEPPLPCFPNIGATEIIGKTFLHTLREGFGNVN